MHFLVSSTSETSNSVQLIYSRNQFWTGLLKLVCIITYHMLKDITTCIFYLNLLIYLIDNFRINHFTFHSVYTKQSINYFIRNIFETKNNSINHLTQVNSFSYLISIYRFFKFVFNNSCKISLEKMNF